jgi:anti-anti-sigma factor
MARLQGRAQMKPDTVVGRVVPESRSRPKTPSVGSGSRESGEAPAATFDVQEDVHGDCYTLSLHGELDMATAPTLQAAIVRLCDRGAREIVLDLHELTSIDASGLRLIMTAGQACERYGCDFALARAQTPAQKLFDLSGAIGQLSFRGRSFAKRIAKREAPRASAPVNLLRPDFDMVLHLNRDAPWRARNYVRDLLRVNASHELCDAVMLLTSEIVTPIVERGTTAFLECGELLVWLRADLVRVEFRAPGELLSSAPEDGRRGYDAHLLDELADRWSIDAGGATACIWFEIEHRRWRGRESQSTPEDGAHSMIDRKL